MTYVSLYRKYRSQSFNELVGQTPITRTLQNAIRSGRVAHAYLFCGPRGTGKTSTARLLAKALNCIQGPTPEPCNECDACNRIRDGHAMDVVEIDAASNRGIDEIRNLRENVKFVPTEGRYKIYVIDEVHMLTTEAFNALLKTLEEPPDNVVFVLATTEAHKVPATVLSRCQRFDFKRGSLQDLLQRLEFVAGSEGVDLDPQAANLLAKNAEGSWRDALSLLEQVIAFSGNKVTLADTAAVLGTVDTELLCRVVDQLASGEAGAAFKLADELLATGRDLRQLLWGLTEHYRNLLVARLSRGPSSLAEVPKEILPILQRQAEAVTVDQAMQAIETLSEADKESRWNNQHRLILEVTLLKLVGLHSGAGKTAPQPAVSSQEVPAPPVHTVKPKPVETSEPESAPEDEEMPPLPDEPPPLESGIVSGLSDLQASWNEIVNETIKLSGKGGSARPLYQFVTILKLEDSTVVLKAQNKMGQDKAVELKNYIAEVLSRRLGRKVTCRVLLANEPQQASTQVPVKPAASGNGEVKKEQEKASQAPKRSEQNRKVIRQEALKIFDGTIEGG